MDEGIEEIRDGVVPSQLVDDKGQVLQLVHVQGPARGPPLGLELLGADAAEADAPALQQHDLRPGLARLVDREPRGRRGAVAPPAEGGLVVLGHVGGAALAEGGEDVAHERDVVGAGLAAALHQGVVRVRGGEVQLVLVAEVEVVDADDDGLEELPLLERLGEGLDERGLPNALHAVEAYDEGAAIGCGLLVLVGLEALKYWQGWSALRHVTQLRREGRLGCLLNGMHLGDLSSTMRDWSGTSGVEAISEYQESAVLLGFSIDT